MNEDVIPKTKLECFIQFDKIHLIKNGNLHRMHI